MKNLDYLFKTLTEHIAATDASGYTIQYPPAFTWRALAQTQVIQAWRSLLRRGDISKIGLYVHVPFCASRCEFCRYHSEEETDPAAIADYLEDLKTEARRYSGLFRTVPFKTLYIGGGTPSLLREQDLIRFFRDLNSLFDLRYCQQISFEATPHTLNRKKLAILKKYKVNRLTLGVQSLDPNVLRINKRKQTAAEVYSAYRYARQLAIPYINIDLMAGLPGQSLASFLATLSAIIRVRPDTIHLHPFYPTPFTNFIRREQTLTPEAMDIRNRMCNLGAQMMTRAGYRPTPFDAPSLSPAARNIHLSDAVEFNGPFLGLGCGAVSHATGYLRYRNQDNPPAYHARLRRGTLPIERGIRVDAKDEMIYFATAHLRYGALLKVHFKELFGCSLNQVFKRPILYLQKRGILAQDKAALFFQDRNISSYLIYSKYFYRPSIVNRYISSLGRRPAEGRRLSSEELRYINL